MDYNLNRRQFIQASTAIGAGLYVSGKSLGADAKRKDVINVALLGAGAEGQVLMDAIMKADDPKTTGPSTIITPETLLGASPYLSTF